MPTPRFICGAECGIATAGLASVGVEHWSTVTGTPTVVTSGPSPMRSDRCFRFNAAGAGVFLDASYANITAPATTVVRFYIYFATLPNVPVQLYSTQSFGGQVLFNSADNKICGRVGGVIDSSGGVAVTTGQWYRIDVKTVYDTTSTVDVQVDGVACAQASGSGSSSAAGGFRIGITQYTSAPTADIYVDDIIVSGTSADYPIGAGTVAGLYPNADSAHVYSAAGDFLDGGTAQATLNATSGSETDSWQSLRSKADGGLSTTVDNSNFITAAAPSTGEFLRWTFENLPADATTVNGVGVVSTHHAASATTCTTCLFITDISAGGSTPSAVVKEITHAGTASGGVFLGSLDFSDTTIATHTSVASVGESTGAWTVANVNDLGAVFGTTDANPDVYLDGICLEVDYVPAGDATANAGVVTVTVTILQATGTATNPDATASPGVLAVTTTRLTPNGGAGGTITAIALPVVTMRTPNGGAGGVPPSVQPTVTRLTPAGGAGGTTTALARTVTVLPVVNPDATANAGVVVATTTVLAPAGGAGGTVGVKRVDVLGSQDTITLDSIGRADNIAATGGNGPITWSHTLGSGNGRRVVVACGQEGATGVNQAIGQPTVTFDGVAMTLSADTGEQVAGSGTHSRGYQFTMDDTQLPAAGTYTIVVTFTTPGSPARCWANSISATGISQGAADASNATETDTAVTSLQTTVGAVGSGGWVFDVFWSGANSTALPTVDSGQVNVRRLASGANSTGGMSTKPSGGASTTVGWSWNTANSAGVAAAGWQPLLVNGTLTPTGGASGVTTDLLVPVTLLQPTATGGGSPDATANAGVVAATASTLGLIGGAGGTASRPAATATLPLPGGGAGGTEQQLAVGAFLLAPGGSSANSVGVVARTTTVLAPAIGAGGTTQALARTTSILTMTGGAGGTTATLPINVTVLGVSQPSATANAGVVAVTATVLAPSGGAGGTTTALLAAVTVLAPSPGVSATPAPVTPIVSMLTMTGSAGGTTTTLPIIVTVLTSVAGGNAIVTPNPVIVTVSPQTPNGGAGGTTQAPVARTVTVLQPTATASATAFPGVVAATVTVRTPSGGAGGTTTTLPIGVTVLTLVGGAGSTASAGIVGAGVTALSLAGGAGGTASQPASTTTLPQPGGGSSGTTVVLAAGVGAQAPAGGAGGITQALARTVTVLSPNAGGQSVAQAGVVVATATVRAPTGSAGGTMSPVVATVTVLTTALLTGVFPGGVVIGVDSTGPGVIVGANGGGPGVRTEPRGGAGVTVGSS